MLILASAIQEHWHSVDFGRNADSCMDEGKALFAAEDWLGAARHWLTAHGVRDVASLVAGLRGERLGQPAPFLAAALRKLFHVPPETVRAQHMYGANVQCRC